MTSAGFASDDKSGVSPTVISLPKGPGSVEGLGEAFQPSLNTGTGKYGLKLVLPPGVGGKSGGLSISYEGGDGNGPVGVGWNLPKAYVQRQTDKGVPLYVDGPNGMDDDLDGVVDNPEEIDGFISESSEELVPVHDGAVVNHFCKNEGAFLRYRRVDGHWEATGPDGTRLIFGESEQARIADPDQPSHVFRWLLEREIDTRGNTTLYTYSGFAGADDAAQKYLTGIAYGAGPAPWGGRFHFAALGYEGRPDIPEDCRSGFPVRTGKRLKRVHVGTQGAALAGHLAGDFNGDGVADALNRRYEVAYIPRAPVSLLGSVTLYGADDTTALPSPSYRYTMGQEPAVVSAAGAIVLSRNAPPSVFDQSTVDLVDLNGDALPDILRTSSAGGAHQVCFNQGPGTLADGARIIGWSNPQDVTAPVTGPSPWNFSLQQNEVVLADANGDGQIDLIQMTPFNTYYFPGKALAGQAGWESRRSMESADFVPPSPFGSGGEVRTMDVDFDKRTDIIRSIPVGGGHVYQIWLNRVGDTYNRRTTVSPETGYDFSDRRVQLADINGDRLTDIARITPTRIFYTANIGRGGFLPERSIAIPELTLDDAQLDKASLRDVNGDGLADLVVDRPVPQEIWFWPMRTNRELGNRTVITGLPAALSLVPAIRWADINGNGTTDLIFADSTAAPEERLRSVDIGELLRCTPRPWLLNGISNGIGRVEELIYGTSTAYALADGTNAAGDYTYSWPHPLPFPVQVISEIRTSDSLGGNYVTRFHYHDGFYDPEEKQFRGFARVEQTDAGDATAPTLVTRSHFDVGDRDEALKGRVRRLTREDGAGSAFSDETMDYGVRQLYNGADARAVRFAHVLNRRTNLLEQGRGAPRQLYAEYEYDSYGNRTAERDYGVVEEVNLTASDDERFTVTSFAINPAKWLLRLPFQEEIQDETGKIISRRRTFYDDETFSGFNGGAAIIGNATLVREWSDISADKFIAAKRVRYDAYGNPVALLDPLYGQEPGHWREIAYDPSFHTYPQTETIHVDTASTLTVSAGYDFGFGTIVQSLDFNENPTTYGYDPLARLTSVVRPGDSRDAPTTEYAYLLAQPFGDAGGLINFIETRQRETPGGGQVLSRQFVDGLGRQRLSKQEDAEPGKYVVTQARTFNARREARFVANPYQSPDFSFELPSPAVPVVETLYDALLRPLKTTQQDGKFLSNEYQPLVTRFFDEEDNDRASPHFNTPHAQYKDGLGRLTGVDELSSGQTWPTRYAYDLLDNLTRITDSQANVKTMAYDSLKRMTGMNDPDRGVMTYRYDEASNLRETIDAKAQHIVMAYDGANRIKSEDYLDAAAISPDVSYFYDAPRTVPAGDGTTVTSANVRGKLTRVTDLSGEEYFSFDARARMEWRVKRIPNPENGVLSSYQCAYRYDSLDRLVSHTFPDGDVVDYGYNARGLPVSITGGPTGFIISNITYQPSGQMTGISYGNSVATGYEYDSRLRLLDLGTNSPVAGTLIKFHYGFDGASNITSIEDNRPAATLPANDPRRNTQEFSYDNLYRLTQVKYPATAGQIDYGYDRIGNMLSQTSNILHEEKGLSVTQLGAMSYGGTLDASGASNRQGRTGPQPGPHALTAVSGGSRNYPYDANGNMESIDSMACTWDFKDRLIAVETTEMRADYTYDYTDRRITKKVTPNINVSGLSTLTPERSTSVLYPDRTFEVREHAAPVKYIWNGDTRVARVTTNLNASERLQRFALHPGWNFCTLAVVLTNAGTQLNVAPVQHVYRYDSITQTYATIAPNESLPVGTLLRVYASIVGELALRGISGAPASVNYPAGRHWISNATLQPLDLTSSLTANSPLWFWQARSQAWRSTLHLDIILAGDAPGRLQPGEVIFARHAAPVILAAADPTLEVRYYHQDHIGSSCTMTDTGGQFVNKIDYYPFGNTRQENQPSGLRESYQFGQKERDEESGWSYFEKRFLISSCNRFSQVDPIVFNPQVAISDPQMLGPYSYCSNRPISFHDPSGMLTIAIEYDKYAQYGSAIISIKDFTAAVYPARTRADDGRTAVAPGLYLATSGEHRGQYAALRMTTLSGNRTLPAENGTTRSGINIHRGNRMQPNGVGQTGSESCFVIPWSRNSRDSWSAVQRNPSEWGDYTKFMSQYEKMESNEKEAVVVYRAGQGNEFLKNVAVELSKQVQKEWESIKSKFPWNEAQSARQ